jgi:hypothetical protein
MTIRGDATDPRFVWEVGPNGGRQDVVWPAGYTARFTPKVEVLDPSGRVVLRDGDQLPDGGCAIGQSGANGVIFLIRP